MKIKLEWCPYGDIGEKEIAWASVEVETNQGPGLRYGAKRRARFSADIAEPDLISSRAASRVRMKPEGYSEATAKASAGMICKTESACPGDGRGLGLPSRASLHRVSATLLASRLTCV